jgi:urea carboxylase
MEGPGGYQFVGRTTQVWNRFRNGGLFTENPWALKFFDRVEWYPVTPDELLELRAETDAGRAEVNTTEGTFSIAAYTRFLTENKDGISAFREQQARAFAAEKQRWQLSGEFDIKPDPIAADSVAVVVPDGVTPVYAPFTSSVWQIHVTPGARVKKGEKIVAVEAMKMESVVTAPLDGEVVEIYTRPGEQVAPGQILVAIRGEA